MDENFLVSVRLQPTNSQTLILHIVVLNGSPKFLRKREMTIKEFPSPKFTHYCVHLAFLMDELFVNNDLMFSFVFFISCEIPIKEFPSPNPTNYYAHWVSPWMNCLLIKVRFQSRNSQDLIPLNYDAHWVSSWMNCLLIKGKISIKELPSSNPTHCYAHWLSSSTKLFLVNVR